MSVQAKLFGDSMDEYKVKEIKLGVSYPSTKQTSPGLKYDAEKISMELIDVEFLEEMGRVLDFGKRKYSAHNWRGGIQWGRTIGAVLRHTLAYLNGEDRDPETGLNHMAHAAVNCMFLVWFAKHRRSFDDRYKDVVPFYACGSVAKSPLQNSERSVLPGPDGYSGGS